MSNTRRAKDRSVFYQNRFASSPEFERGLLGNLVAKRCTVLESMADRELVWFIQHISHLDGGLPALAGKLFKEHRSQIDTDALDELNTSIGWASFSRHIEHYLNEICLDPKIVLNNGPYFFKDLVTILRGLHISYAESHKATFVTALGTKVYDALDYTAFSRGLTLIEGEARRGKSFAAKTWCYERPGLARFVEVSPGNDDAGFFRALARGLGLGNLTQYKACDIRERVESVLLSCDLVLVLDEAQRLWPQCNLRYGFPNRIVWIMTMANAGVPIAMVSTPQFIEIQKAVEKNGWNGSQLTGRISHYEPLPADISAEDLMGVAKAVLPEAPLPVLKALAVYARSSARYLAAIETISKRAGYIAMKDRREKITADDVRMAMKESVIPADTKLHSALQRSGNRQRLKPMPADEHIAGPHIKQRREEDFSSGADHPALDRRRLAEAPLKEA